jgi:hypothetical protein
VKTYPVADGGCARHLCLMLQARGAGCRGSAIVADVQAEGCEEILIWRQTLPRVGSRSILANLWLPV